MLTRCQSFYQYWMTEIQLPYMHSSISFQNKLTQQQFRKACGDSLLLPFCCHCVCLSFHFKMSAITVCVHICWQKSLRVKFGFPWVKERVSCMRSRLCLQSFPSHIIVVTFFMCIFAFREVDGSPRTLWNLRLMGNFLEVKRNKSELEK